MKAMKVNLELDTSDFMDALSYVREHLDAMRASNELMIEALEDVATLFRSLRLNNDIGQILSEQERQEYRRVEGLVNEALENYALCDERG